MDALGPENCADSALPCLYLHGHEFDIRTVMNNSPAYLLLDIVLFALYSEMLLSLAGQTMKS